MFHKFSTLARKQVGTPTRQFLAGMGLLTVPTVISQTYQPSFSKYLPSLSFFQNTFIAHAKVLPPHPDFPPPTTIKEAIDYNEYPPGFTEALPEYTEAQKKGIGVKKIVAANVEDEVINDSEHDIFLKISKDNCHSCASFSRVLDALSFAFRDVPSVRFAEMKGTRNYIPGVLTAEEEMLYPTFKFFPAGTETIDQMEKAKSFVENVRKYNQEVLQAHDPLAPVGDLTLDIEKRTFPGVGMSVDMFMPDKDVYVWEAFIDDIASKAKHKFDADKVKAQVKVVEPALKKEITHTIRQSMPAYELVGSLAPCGAQWDAFQDAMTRRGVGAALISEFHETMDSLQRCVSRQHEEEDKFWRSNIDHASHMLVVLNLVKEAKLEGLPEERIGDFFIQMNRMLGKRKEERDRRKAEAESHLTSSSISEAK